MNEQAERIALGLTEARAETLSLFDLAEESELHRSPGFDSNLFYVGFSIFR